MVERAAGSGSPTLLLFPTELEQRRFLDAGGLPVGLALQALCGFGPVAAAARTAELCARVAPRRVLLIGIAGAYDVERDPVGCARVFEGTALDGVGAGEGAGFRGPTALGFPQWPSRPGVDGAAIEDRLPLWRPQQSTNDRYRGGGTLLTTCAAADGPEMAARRRERFADAGAEDMEGFAVAFACTLARVPVAVVRGISNLVGDRDGTRWRIPQALASAREAALEILAQDAWEPSA
ncbi:futalosine hydrolase [Engelhardtia mirabilis]|uniref:Futalosine hydrolase n=1 Tax=Engelhardtia mirabilis TaxID=2528011 RepID=A0A518BN63_9BACT|nr:Futalosine hydrolase [Planctomycetes bacterium Pla133]QDV02722.1 Futalosine hydrolase [Planctomycetes bacterium Pla86]